MVFAERLKNPVADVNVSAEGFLEVGKVGPLSRVQGAGDLIDVVPDAPNLAEKLAKGLVVSRRAALGAGSWVAESGGAHESGDGETRPIGLLSNAGELLICPSDERLMGAPPLIASAGHRCTRALSWRAAHERADIFFDRETLFAGPGRQYGLLFVG